MNVAIKETNTTEVTAKLDHDQIVKLLGLAVKVQAGIPSDQFGCTETVKLLALDGSDKFEAEVDVLVDHNAKPPVESPKESPVSVPEAPAETPVESPVPDVAAESAALVVPSAVLA